MARALDFDTLALCKESFVAETMAHFFADIVYTCALRDGGEASVYLLLEHKSSPKSACAIQILRYMVMLWERELEKQPQLRQLPPVVPMVIYHGERNWEARQMKEFFPKDTPFHECLPLYAMHVLNLSEMDESEIKGSILGKSSLLFFKALHEREPMDRIVKLFEMMLSALSEERALPLISKFLYYVYNVREDVTREEMERKLAALPAGEGERIMKDFMKDFGDLAYQKGMEAGMEKGMEAGMEKGMEAGMEAGRSEGIERIRRLLLDVLALRFGSIPSLVITKIESNNDMDSLGALHKDAILAGSLEEFEAMLEKALGGKRQ